MKPFRTYNCVPTKTNPSFHVCTYHPSVDRFISSALVSDGIWEPYITPIVQRALNKYPDAAFIDVGANLGYYSILAARMGHHVIAVEPALENVRRLHQGAWVSRVLYVILETFMGVDQRTREGSKLRIPRVVSKSDSIFWTATMATEPLG